MLSDFLFDIENSKEQNQFKFNGTLVCSEPVPPIIVRANWKWKQSRKNPVSVSAMLTEKFLQIRKVFATSLLLAEEFLDTLQYKIPR